MNKKILASLTVLFLFSSTAILANNSTNTDTSANKKPPQFEKGMMPSPHLNSKTPIGNPPKDFKGNPLPQMKNKKETQMPNFNGKIPSKKPNKKPNGDKKPLEFQN